MSTLDLIFFILRHVDTHEHDLLWKECFHSIRKFYPDTMIVIIDNGSDQTIVNTTAPDEKSVIHTSELPNGRLFVPYYYYLTYYSAYTQAVILHDGAIIQRPIPLHKIDTVKYLWHFKTHQWDIKHIGHALLNSLRNTEELHTFYDKNEWHGCLGCMSVINQSFLQKLQDKYSILSLKDHIKTKDEACEFERILSVLCTYENPELLEEKSASLFGDISTLEWGLRYSTYMANRKNYTRYGVVKLFGSR